MSGELEDSHLYRIRTWYRIKRWFFRYFYFTAALDGINSVVAITIAVLAYSEYPRTAYALGGLFVIILSSRIYLVVKRRRSRYYTEKKVIHDFFYYMNNKMFDGAAGHRFTLFIIDPVNSNFITPYVRFEVGGTNAIEAAERSKARYLKGIGYTGMAWEKTKFYLSHPFPDFNSREQFEDYYINILKIPKDIVEDISNYMVKVKHIFCYGLVDKRDQFLGVLSLDSLSIWEKNPESLAEMLSLLELLLESFFRSGLRK